MTRLGKIWIVAGAPGAGKSTAAALVLAHLDPTPALLDKDTMYQSLVDATLVAGGKALSEREGEWYDTHIKTHEYRGMIATAREIRSHGTPVMLCGPFTNQIRDEKKWSELVDLLGGGAAQLVWIRSDAATLKARIIERGREADGWKLENWAAFVERMQPDEPPPVPHMELDNRTGAEPMKAQVERL